MEANGDINNGKRRVNRREQWLWRENRLALLDPITFGCKALFIALGTHAWDDAWASAEVQSPSLPERRI